MERRELDIIKKITEGEFHLFEEFVTQYYKKVYLICFGIVQNKEDAEDLTQEVFINAYSSLSKFKGGSTFSTWLYRISVNCSLELIRKRKRSPFFWKKETTKSEDQFYTIDSLNNTAENDLIKKDEEKILAAAIASLPQKQKIAIILSKYEKLSQKEIAQIMNLGEKAIESLLSRAKANLKKFFEINYR